VKSLLLKISNLFWALAHFSFSYKKKVHYLFFIPMYGFFPWVFKRNRFDIFLVTLPIEGFEILFYLSKKSGDVCLNWEIRKHGLIVDFGSFRTQIKRRKYRITVIRAKSVTQMTLTSSNVNESIQSKISSDFDFCFIFGKRVLERSFKGPIIYQSIR